MPVKLAYGKQETEVQLGDEAIVAAVNRRINLASKGREVRNWSATAAVTSRQRCERNQSKNGGAFGSGICFMFRLLCERT